MLVLLLGALYALSGEVEVPTVIIDQHQSEIQSPLDEYSVFKAEKVESNKLKDPSRSSLGEIVKDQVGVDSQVYCANCGAKRLTINGLKGEHTSILIDGLPLHSAVSSFYGVDNIPSAGLLDIQVMRGAGASLTNPEAIGGTLNLITIDPLDSSSSYLTSVGIDDSSTSKSDNTALMYSLQSESGRSGLAIGGQVSHTQTWDIDENNVAELPKRSNYSLFSKTRLLLGKKNDISLRLGASQLEILGGHVRPTKPNTVRPLPAQESDFENGNVEKKYSGEPEKITDWVKAERTEAALTGVHYSSGSTTFDWKLGFSQQDQKAIYQHGFDYANVDSLFVADTSVKHLWDGNQILTLGVFLKDQRLRSASEHLFEKYPEDDERDIKKDNFNFLSNAVYLQYSYFEEEIFEFDAALRLDQININWLELTNKINKSIVAPRFQVLHHLADHLTQRLSYGLGYRAPLTFFESQHGNNESGYQVDIDELEQAHSVVYSLSFNTPTYYVTGATHYTHLQKMAYGFEEFNQPIKYRNSKESYDIWVSDLLLGYKPKDWWLLETSFENFQYENGYKRKLPTAAIEQRMQLKSSITKKKWTHSLSVNLIGARDLSKYGSYNDHYANRNQSSEPLLDSSLELKDQNSPAYFTIDTSASYQFYEALTLGFAINNLLNYTQTSAGDSPSTWHWHFNHAHYDGLHTWGPNAGRQFFLSLSGTF